MPLIAAQDLRRLVLDLLGRAGTPDDIADVVADSLIGADLAGHGSHGVLKLPSYLRDIELGRLKPPARPFVVDDGPATAVLDGAGGYGHLAARLAVDLVLDKAGHCGLAAVVVSHAHHTGRLGGWSELIAAAGLIGMLTGGEGQGPWKVAPHGGASGAMATNPVTWAVPRAAGEPPVVLDYATSVVSIGKLQIARAAGAETVPPGWLLDEQGQPTTRLEDFFTGGHLLPFGGHKGSALALIAELLAVGLSAGDRFGGGERSSCLFVLAVDPGRIRPPAQLHQFVDSTVQRLKSVPGAAETAEVLVPGEPEQRARESAPGVTLPDAVWRSLCTAAAGLGVIPPSPRDGDRRGLRGHARIRRTGRAEPGLDRPSARPRRLRRAEPLGTAPLSSC
ncbi:Ldh family oxidoreductase [Micromonospora sp. NPDC050187]|uniref:Ldh family oxidoreductase n=1 Tax=Micromonospora sp. NPDC050187 TaxID=3364277 RepID=UPI0037A5644F